MESVPFTVAQPAPRVIVGRTSKQETAFFSSSLSAFRHLLTRAFEERNHPVTFDRMQVSDLYAQQADKRVDRLARRALTHEVRRFVGVNDLVQDVEQFLFDLVGSVESHDFIRELEDVDFHGKLDESSPVKQVAARNAMKVAGGRIEVVAINVHDDVVLRNPASAGLLPGKKMHWRKAPMLLRVVVVNLNHQVRAVVLLGVSERLSVAALADPVRFHVVPDCCLRDTKELRNYLALGLRVHDFQHFPKLGRYPWHGPNLRRSSRLKRTEALTRALQSKGGETRT